MKMAIGMYIGEKSKQSHDVCMDGCYDSTGFSLRERRSFRH